LVGVESLRQLLGAAPVNGNHEVERPAAESQDLQHPGLKQLVDELAADGHGLIMLMGKGGVGKTTLAAAVAVELASRGLPVHLTTSDPAAHLGETLAGALPSLEVSRIDPHAETERYRAQVLATKGASLDAQGRALLEEDLRSPCTEEIAVFQAFSRIIREAGKRFVVMDTAPTGHTLLLLDATGAYHREIARQMGGKGMHFTTPMMQLQDPKQTKVMIVTLPEPTPVQEAANLQADLRRAGIEPWAWVVNHMLAPASVTSPLLAQRAYRQQPHIDAVKGEHARRYAVVPLQAVEPVGVTALQALCHPVHRAG
jgi:arsenite-transporting ATPase